MGRGCGVAEGKGVGVNTVEEFYEALKKVTGSSVKISGVYPGYFGNYAFILNLND